MADFTDAQKQTLTDLKATITEWKEKATAEVTSEANFLKSIDTSLSQGVKQSKDETIAAAQTLLNSLTAS